MTLFPRKAHSTFDISIKKARRWRSLRTFLIAAAETHIGRVAAPTRQDLIPHLVLALGAERLRPVCRVAPAEEGAAAVAGHGAVVQALVLGDLLTAHVAGLLVAV